MKSRFNYIIIGLMLACGLALGGNLYLMNATGSDDIGQAETVKRSMPDNSAARAAAGKVRTKQLPQIGNSGGAKGKRVSAPKP